MEKYEEETPVPAGSGMMMAMSGGLSHSGMGGSMSGMKPSPEMIEKLKARFKTDPDSIPPQFHDMLERSFEEENMTDDKKKKLGKQELSGHGGPIGSGRPSPEMIEKLKEQYRADPDSLPPNVREMVARSMAEDDASEK